jgi:hypothetical protein
MQHLRQTTTAVDGPGRPVEQQKSVMDEAQDALDQVHEATDERPRARRKGVVDESVPELGAVVCLCEVVG